jgi:preprotein translocase subunit YajC
MLATPAYAQTAGAAAPNGFAAMAVNFAPMMFRPQMQQQKRHRAALAAVKKGDTVVTAGGVIGKVTRVDDAEVEVEIAANTRIKVVKATLSDVRPLGGAAKPAND